MINIIVREKIKTHHLMKNRKDQYLRIEELLLLLLSGKKRPPTPPEPPKEIFPPPKHLLVWTKCRKIYKNQTKNIRKNTALETPAGLWLYKAEEITETCP